MKLSPLILSFLFYPTAKAVLPCQASSLQLDLAIVADVSITGGIAGWLKISSLNLLLQSIVQPLDLHSTRLALITYDTQVSVRSNFGNCTSKSCWKALLPLNGTPRVYRKLDKALGTLRKDPARDTMVLIITDGVSSQDPISIAQQLKATGVIITAIVPQYSKAANQQLKKVVSDLNQDLAEIPSYSLLMAENQWVWTMICNRFKWSTPVTETPTVHTTTSYPPVTTTTATSKGTTTTTTNSDFPTSSEGTGSHPSTSQTPTTKNTPSTSNRPTIYPCPLSELQADFIFILDLSITAGLEGVTAQLNILRGLIRKLTFEQGKNRMAILLFTSYSMPWTLLSQYNSSRLIIDSLNRIEYIPYPGQNIADAFNDVRTVVMKGEGFRPPPTPNTVFFFSSWKYSVRDPTPMARELRNAGLYLYGIALSPDANRQDLRSWSTKGEIFEMNNYSTDLKSVENWIIAKVCVQ